MGRIVAIASAFNEDGNLHELVEQFSVVRSSLSQHDLQLVIVDNGSTDSTVHELSELHERFDWLQSIRLVRNFRMAGALLAGLASVEADAYVLMAADLQDHPSSIPLFIPPWERGAYVVNAEITRRNGTPLSRRIMTAIFYFLANLLSRGALPRNVSDFRLIDRKVRDSLLDLPERKKFLRGTIAWLEFPTEHILLERPPRNSGESKAGTRAMINLAFRGIIYGSSAPLRFASVLGLFLSIFALILQLFFVFRTLAFGVPFDGFGTLVSIAIVAFGIQMLILGIIGEYLFTVFEEVKARPDFIIRQKRLK